MLYEFIARHRREITALCCDKIALRTEAPELPKKEVPVFLNLFVNQLVEILNHKNTSGVKRSAASHGASMQGLGYPVSDVTRDYEDVGRVILGLVLATGELIDPEDLAVLYRCVDEASAAGAFEFERLRDREITRCTTQKAAIFAHELRNKAASAMLGFQSIVSGRAPIRGGVSAVVTRSLSNLNLLIDTSLLESRVETGTINRQLIHLHQFMEELREEGIMMAESRGIGLEVAVTSHEIDVRVDKQMLSSILQNLLQNAFKFTPQGGHVLVRTSSFDNHVMIDVTDECGGLPGKPEELFQPFEQRSVDKSGMGLGLYISRQGTEANGGQLVVNDLPGVGCVFTVDLPMALAS